MSVVSVNYSKISAEKLGPVQGKVTVSNNVSITDVKRADFVIGSVKQDCLRFSFAFVSKTEPKVGSIDITGEVIFLASKEDVDSSLKQWEEKKPLKKEILGEVINNILKKCNIEALILSQTMNLPSPIRLPTANVTEAVPAKSE
jgi:hypothetical protein